MGNLCGVEQEVVLGSAWRVIEYADEFIEFIGHKLCCLECCRGFGNPKVEKERQRQGFKLRI
jgi:hypothetical protein